MTLCQVTVNSNINPRLRSKLKGLTICTADEDVHLRAAWHRRHGAQKCGYFSLFVGHSMS